MMKEPLLNTSQAAELVNLSRRTLEKLRCQGGGPRFIRLGASVRYETRDLVDWVAGCKRRSTSDPGPAEN